MVNYYCTRSLHEKIQRCLVRWSKHYTRGKHVATSWHDIQTLDHDPFREYRADDRIRGRRLVAMFSLSFGCIRKNGNRLVLLVVSSSWLCLDRSGLTIQAKMVCLHILICIYGGKHLDVPGARE